MSKEDNMAEFVPSRKWSELIGKTVEGISKMPCLEITDEEGNMIGDYGVFLIVPKTDFIRAQMDSQGQLSNSLYVPEEVIEEVPEEAPLYVSNKPTLQRKKRRKKVAV